MSLDQHDDDRPVDAVFTAVMAELIATASIFQRNTLMPSACAASSFSRIACQ